MKNLILALTVIAAAALLPGAAFALPSLPGGVPDLCGGAIATQERIKGIPKNFLRAVGLAESGRWDTKAGQGVPWPWTVNAEGEGNYYPTKAAALAAVRKLQARGVKSIDVGCMQINLYWHGDAFRSLSDAFEPEHNVAYAADFLSRLKEERRNWQNAAGYYHSATPEFNNRYRAKVIRLWNGIRDGNFAEIEDNIRFPEPARAAALRSQPTVMPDWAKGGGAATSAGSAHSAASRAAPNARLGKDRAVTDGNQGLAAYRKRMVPVAQRFIPQPENLAC
ncbi:MAG: transglycosylase SLT domain-containing protein [Alphaproteobacteria bacterium]|nr:transglycosylase SLT domain-containing protein [Alphaproteobacteria bacterium]